MTSAELCDLLVEHFNAIASGERPIEYEAEHPATVGVADAERTNWRVFVLEFEESEEPINLNGDTCRQSYTPQVVVNGPVNQTTTKAMGVALQKLLRESLKGVELGGCEWAGNEVPKVCDSEALEKSQFLSLFRPTFYEFA